MRVQQEAGLILFDGNPPHGAFVLTTTNATALPTLAGVRGRLITIRARRSNVGSVWLGSSSNLTADTGSTNTTTGHELAPGEWYPFPLCATLLQNYFLKGASGDGLTYMVHGEN